MLYLLACFCWSLLFHTTFLNLNDIFSSLLLIKICHQWTIMLNFLSLVLAKVCYRITVLRFQSLVFIRQWIHWTPHLGCFLLAFLVKVITIVHVVCKRFCKATRICKTLLQSWVWMSSVRMTRWQSQGHGKSKGSWVSLSMSLKSSLVHLGNTLIWRIVSQVSRYVCLLS